VAEDPAGINEIAGKGRGVRLESFLFKKKSKGYKFLIQI